MNLVFPALLVLSAALVATFSARLSRHYNPLWGGIFGLVLWLSHPLLWGGALAARGWDAFWLILFFAAWAFMEEWSLFMRSWLLAGLFAFGLWIGTPFVPWVTIMLVPRIFFCRRPVDALVKTLTVVFGGLALYGAVWGLLSLAAGHRLPFTGCQAMVWNGPARPQATDLPFLILLALALWETLQAYREDHRADIKVSTAMMIVLFGTFGPMQYRPALLSLSCALIAVTLTRREILYSRMVRWIAAYGFLISLGVVLGRHAVPGWVGMPLILGSAFALRTVNRGSSISWKESAAAAAFGAALGLSSGIVLLR